VHKNQSYQAFSTSKLHAALEGYESRRFQLYIIANIAFQANEVASTGVALFQ
jgi:hypothetical protein